jgi:hypothetical protein
MITRPLVNLDLNWSLNYYNSSVLYVLSWYLGILYKLLYFFGNKKGATRNGIISGRRDFWWDWVVLFGKLQQPTRRGVGIRY